LTPTELRQKKAELRRQAREGLCTRLDQSIQTVTQQPERDDWIAWLTVERLALEVRLGRDLDAVTTACWRYLGDAPRPRRSSADATLDRLRDLLHDRYLLTLAHVTLRLPRNAEAITRLLKYVDAGSATDSFSHAWKQFKAYFLIALDRTADL